MVLLLPDIIRSFGGNCYHRTNHRVPCLSKLLIIFNGDYMKLITKLTLAGVLSLTITACDGGNTGDNITEDDDNSSSTPLDATEASHLTFMREEEKLARDVYLTFAASYPDQPVFDNIANKSEQTHTDTMRDKLELYNLSDPNPDTNNLPESLGVFTGEEWGWYFDKKFAELTTKGGNSELDALYVGAFIEELDMHDIADCPEVMTDEDGTIYPDPCGLHYTDELGLINAYSFLIDGSERHLRTFVGQIEAIIGTCNYEAQYISQTDVDAILGRTCE